MVFVDPCTITSGCVRIFARLLDSSLSTVASTLVSVPIRLIWLVRSTMLSPNRLVMAAVLVAIISTLSEILVSLPIASSRNCATALPTSRTSPVRLLSTLESSLVISATISSPDDTEISKVTPEEYVFPEYSISTRAK